MNYRPFGTQGFSVSILGFGAAHVGNSAFEESEAERILNAVLDLGINLIDTARGYGLSEERIGRYLAHRRGEYILSSKGGYGVEGVPDWTGEVITKGIERALRLMQTEHIDIFHLHSCPLEIAQREDILKALEQARQAGQIRIAAYSAENAALEWAVGCGHFGSVQTSVNLFDQRNQISALPTALQKGVGVIAKRPVANVPWQFEARPVGQYAEEYWHRMKTMALEPIGMDWHELALRYSAHVPGVSSIIAGTRSLKNLRKNVELVNKGPLPQSEVERWNAAFAAHDNGWIGQV